MKYLIDLNLLNIKFLKVIRLTTKKSTKLNKILPIYLVQVSPDSDISELYKIQYLNNQIVKWEKLNKTEILQCKRCQRLGHAAPNCRMDYRCVKCDKMHNPGECTIHKTDNSQKSLFCVLCKSYGHPASYRGCTQYLKLKQALNDRKNVSKEKLQQRSMLFNNYIEPKKSFADLLRNPNKKTLENVEQTSNQPDFNHINSTLSSICNQFKAFDEILKENTRRINAIYQTLPFLDG